VCKNRAVSGYFFFLVRSRLSWNFPDCPPYCLKGQSLLREVSPISASRDVTKVQVEHKPFQRVSFQPERESNAEYASYRRLHCTRTLDIPVTRPVSHFAQVQDASKKQDRINLIVHRRARQISLNREITNKRAHTCATEFRNWGIKRR